MLRFDIINEKAQAQALIEAKASVKREAPDSDSEHDVSTPAKIQKQKKSTSGLSDAKLAAQLPAEEDARSRPSRVAKKVTAPKRKKPIKKKSANKIKGDDDSSILGSDGEKIVKEKKGGFHVCILTNLSRPLLTD